MVRRLVKGFSCPKHAEKRSRVGSIGLEDGHTFDLNDIILRHAWPGEVVNLGPMCKREKASIVS